MENNTELTTVGEHGIHHDVGGIQVGFPPTIQKGGFLKPSTLDCEMVTLDTKKLRSLCDAADFDGIPLFLVGQVFVKPV